MKVSFYLNRNKLCNNETLSVPVTAMSKAWVCGRSLAWIAVWNTVRGMDACLL